MEQAVEKPVVDGLKRPESPLRMLGRALGSMKPSETRELSRVELKGIYREINAAKDSPGNRGLHSVDDGVEIMFRDTSSEAEGSKETKWRVVILNTTEHFSGGWTSRRIALWEGDKMLISYLSDPTDDQYQVLQSLRAHALPLKEPLSPLRFLRVPSFLRRSETSES